MQRRATTAPPAPTRSGAFPALGPRVRARWASFAAGVAQLVLLDQSVVPTEDEIRQWVDALIGSRPTVGSVEAIRTGALFPAAADRFAAVGFHAIDVLALLEFDLSRMERPRFAARPREPRRPHRVRPLRHRDHDAASIVDRRAFGDPWGYSATDLADVRRATPRHRASAVRDDGRLTAFAISGAAGGNGYLQRLAVDPDAQREGQATALVIDSLAWMARRHLGRATVNTGVANTAALALYASTGFRPLTDRLQVMQLDLLPPPARADR